MTSQYHFFNFIWVPANEGSRETTRLWQGYRISPRLLSRHWCPYILTSILEGRRNISCCPARLRLPDQGVLLFFSHLLWINSTPTAGRAKPRKTASDLTEFSKHQSLSRFMKCFVNQHKRKALCSDILGVFSLPFSALHTTLSTAAKLSRLPVPTDFHRRCRHAFQVWKPVFSKPRAGTKWSLV